MTGSSRGERLSQRGYPPPPAGDPARPWSSTRNPAPGMERNLPYGEPCTGRRPYYPGGGRLLWVRSTWREEWFFPRGWSSSSLVTRVPRLDNSCERPSSFRFRSMIASAVILKSPRNLSNSKPSFLCCRPETRRQGRLVPPWPGPRPSRFEAHELVMLHALRLTSLLSYGPAAAATAASVWRRPEPVASRPHVKVAVTPPGL